MSGARALYLSYDGLTDPLGASQVLPYLRELSRLGHKITIVSCEKPEASAEQRRKVQDLCDESGLEWHPLRYHRRPPVLSTILDLAAMRRTARALHRRHRFEIVHCRSYVPALVGLALKRRFGIPLLFDMRGFWADERLEGGSWPQGNPVFRLIYRYFKRKEAELLRESDAVVSLTEVARDEMLSRFPELDSARVSVIPCCVDFGRFAASTPERRLEARAELGIPVDLPVLGYVGSLGGNYLLDEMLALFREFREERPGARFLFITRGDPAAIFESAERLGIARQEIVVRAAEHDEVPRLASAADLGIAFKAPGYSSKACCPTKLGEMMALGLPVLANAGVGDVERILSGAGVGSVVSSFDPAALRNAAAEALKLTDQEDRIRAEARRRFALQDGVARYDSIYRSIARAGGNGEPRLAARDYPDHPPVKRR